MMISINLKIFRNIAILYCFLLLSTSAIGQNSIGNNYFTIQPATQFKTNPSFTITHKSGKLTRTIIPRLQLIYTEESPELVAVSLDGQPGTVAWHTTTGQTSNIKELGSTELIAQSFQIKNNRIRFS